MGKGLNLIIKIANEVDKANKRSIKKKEKTQKEYERSLELRRIERDKEEKEYERSLERERREEEKEEREILARKKQEEKEALARRKEILRREDDFNKKALIRKKDQFNYALENEKQIFEKRVNSRKELCLKMTRELLK